MSISNYLSCLYYMEALAIIILAMLVWPLVPFAWQTKFPFLSGMPQIPFNVTDNKSLFAWHTTIPFLSGIPQVLFNLTEHKSLFGEQTQDFP